MISVLMVCRTREAMSEFADAMEKQDDVTLSWAESGAAGLDAATEKAFHLAVVDEALDDMTGIAFAEKLVAVNPMVNCALVSRLPSDDYHEATEGLGLLMQLPEQPGGPQAKKLLDRLRKILGMTKPGD